MIRGLICALALLAPLAAAQAKELDGVAMPDTRVADGVEMRLNGIGLRTFSLLGIPVYVAGLYLEQQSNNPDVILHSSERKLLDIRFVRDVDAEAGRKAWRDGFEQNCKSPCSLDPARVQQFLQAIPAIHKGDETTLLFTPRGATVMLNGRPMGNVPDPHFAQVMLTTFIGPEPPTARLKRELLGGRD